MPLLKDLLNAGVLPHDAQALETHFAAEPEFLDGLEQIARCLALKESPSLIPPAGQPWKNIHTAMLLGGDLDTAFTIGIAGLDTVIQVAISGAVSVRKREILTWLQQSQQGTGKRRKTHEYERVLKNLGLDFRFNMCTLNYEVNSAPLTDGLECQLRQKFRDANVWETNVMEDVYTGQGWGKRYHPVKDYFSHLSFQGGDPISDLAGHFQDRHGMFPVLLRRWLVGAVARVMAGSAGVQNRVLILDGGQGLGKSHFAHWLAAPLPEYFHEGPIDPDPQNKDHLIRLIGVWLWEVNEFSRTTRRSDRDELKAFLTTQTVRVRPPYGRRDIQAPAMTSFLGTVNNESGILNDPTGSRRFMIAHLEEINWDYVKFDVDQVWAQAHDLYISGEKWEPTRDEMITINEINAEYQSIDLVEETISRWFVIDPKNTLLSMSTVEIMEVLKDSSRGNLKPGTEIDTRRLASALTKLGLDRPQVIKSGGRLFRGYRGIRLGP